MISIVVPKMGMTELIFVVPGMKVNGQYYRDVFLSLLLYCQRSSILQATRLSFNKTALHLIVQGPLNSYSKKHRTSLVLITGRAQKRPDLNLVDYKVWGVVQQTAYECRMNSVDELMSLIGVWNSLQQNAIDAAINEWRKQLRACMHADGQHFEHLLRTRVTNKSYGQIKYKYLKRRSFTAELVIFGVLKFFQDIATFQLSRLPSQRSPSGSTRHSV